MFVRTLSLIVALLPTFVFAQSGAKIPDPDPEIERKSFIVADGFEVNLFAADPLLAKPIQMNFDPQGRLWVASSEIYPHIKPGEKANDKILILEDTKGVGKADKVTIFADGLLIPTGVEPGDGGAYVANSTEMLHLSASKPGGKADKKRIVLSGFGTEDTHHILHTFRWGPDGMLYMNQSTYIHSHIETPYGVRRLNGGGIWQFRPETNQLEVFVRGFINTWGHHFDRYGQSFVTDGANGEGITHGIPGFAYSWAIGTNRIHHGLNPGSPKHCGLEVLSGTHLPEEWRGNLLTNDFRGHRVCRFVLKEDGSTFASQEKTELIKSNHPAFRPIDIKMGPDGAIYIADWYNPIIQHGEIDFRDPRRDHTHGRIWRVTAKNRPLVKKPELVNAKTADLLEHLKAPEDWTRHNARRVLKERGARKVMPDLLRWTKLQEDEVHALEALWLFQSFDEVNTDLLNRLLNAKDYHIRAAAVRVLAHWQDRVSNALGLLSARVNDENPRVRLEAVRALATLRNARAAEVALTALDRPVDKVLDYAIWLTTKELEPHWMPVFKEGKLDFGGNPRHLAFALESVGNAGATGPVFKLLESKKLTAEREHALWLLLGRVGSSEELGRVLTKAADTASAEARAQLVGAVEESVRQRKVGRPKDLAMVKSLLDHTTEADLATIRLIGLWRVEEYRERIEAIATAKGVSPEKLAAAYEGLVALGGPKTRAFIESQTDPKMDATTRRLAIVALAAIDLPAAATQTVAYVVGTPPSESTVDLFAAFLNRKGGAIAVAKALEGKKIPPQAAKFGIRAVRSSVQDAPELIAALQKAGDLDAQKRELTKKELEEMVADVQKIGNPARGEALYRRADLQCMKCHAIGGAGGQVGPDLASIGASAPVDYLIESLLIPTKAVKEGFHSLRVDTLDGKTHTGIKVRESKTEIVLRSAEDKEFVIPVKDIDEKKESRSLMPDGLVDTLTRGELIDLTRFLSELGKLGPYSLSKTRVVRRWQVLQPTAPALKRIRETRVATAAENDPTFVWNSAYTKVAGELPLAELPKLSIWKDTAELSLVRFHLDVTTAGKVRLRLNAIEGLTMYVGGNPVTPMEETIVDLPVGMPTVLIAIDTTKRQSSVRVEIEDVDGSPARVSILGGK